jgi:hypothetical protein
MLRWEDRETWKAERGEEEIQVVVDAEEEVGEGHQDKAEAVAFGEEEQEEFQEGQMMAVDPEEAAERRNEGEDKCGTVAEKCGKIVPEGGG